MKTLLYISLYLISQSLLAQDRGGNGGDAIVCFDKPLINLESAVSLKPQKAYLKDYWEYSQMITMLDLNLGPGKNYKDKVLYVLDRLAKVDAHRANFLRDRFFSPNMFSFVNRGKLLELNDSNSIIKPSPEKGCYEVQLAFQILSPRMFQSKVLIDENIFNELDESHKAGLILHELLYEQDIKFARAKNSDKIRWFNYVISSDITKLYTDIHEGYSPKYAKMLVENKLDYFEYSKIPADRKDYVKPVAKKSNDSWNGVGSYLLPDNFKIINSHFVKKDELVLQGTMEITANDLGMVLQDLSIKLLQENLFYEFNTKTESLTGVFIMDAFDTSLNFKRISTSNGEIYTVEGVEQDVSIDMFSEVGVKGIESSRERLKKLEISGFTYKSDRFVCRDNCFMHLSDKAVVKIDGMFTVGNMGMKVTKIQNGEIGEVLLANGLSIHVHGSKNDITISNVQKLSVDALGYVGKIYVPNNKNKDVFVKFNSQLYNVGACKESQCSVILIFDQQLRKILDVKRD